MIVFTTAESHTFTHLVFLCTLGPFKTQRLQHERVAFAVRYHNSLVCKQMTTFSRLLLVSAHAASKYSSSLDRVNCKIQLDFYPNQRTQLGYFIRIIVDEICFSTCFYNGTPFWKSPSITDGDGEIDEIISRQTLLSSNVPLRYDKRELIFNVRDFQHCPLYPLSRRNMNEDNICWVSAYLLYPMNFEILSKSIFVNDLTLIYMGYFDYLFYMGGAKSPPPRSNSGI